eukprot:Plantae.Rhodophyta-Palmaria_palmata.ctg995.p1 GENE.Plantae.Rhodophyta-Palmaria_palmata.ctg995~~Plantae.Rhodophyta-Palmaria_palmata.ctg995.p1  ORF type:complete len:609 (-),score=99.66 Plantae.Rhodophyta-Palmaria_palmata.ctg995:34-1791(-)
MRVHKAIRVELRGLLRAASALSDDQVPNPKRLAALAERAAFLGRMVGEHSKAEDIVLLPRLEERCPGVSARYSSEHCEERVLFVQVSAILEELQCASNDVVCGSLVRKLRVVTRTLRDEMVDHLRMEEEHLWPILTKNFTKEEQAEIVGLVFGLMPADRFRELLPWMIRVLSTSEQATMMTHILQVTKSTMFESWLNSWFTPPETKEWDAKVGGRRTKTGSKGKGGRDEGGRSSASVQQPSASASTSLSAVARDSVDETASAAAALVLLHRKDDVKLAIREIAADSSLPAEVRTRMMQRVMLAPWSQRATANSRTSAEDAIFTPSYRDSEKRIFGCTHYARDCKLVANCCGKVYTCRLCHDGAESHTMDRTATKLMLCMHCETRQDVAARCGNAACGKLMARYYCDICVFFQNDPNRNTYHCHCCNVCRVGKGLGQDHFHCTKCNMCMAMKFMHRHVCVERTLESDCPVCGLFLFSSTTPVSYLECGHLMHAACKTEFVKKGHLSCPVCAKSLAELSPVFQKLDDLLAGENMPREYRTAQCDLYCLDCSRPSVAQPYHFLYNRCTHCESYNTRVDHVDPNAGDDY